MDDLVTRLLKEAENELLGFDKTANDQNGAPEAPQASQQQNDIVGMAQSFLAEVQQLKAAVAQGAAGAGDPAAAAGAGDPAAAAAQGAVVAPAAQDAGIIIQRPDGTQIKVAELRAIAQERELYKLAMLVGPSLFDEVN